MELQLRSDEAADISLEELDRQVRDFNATTSRSLDRVAIYRDGTVWAEWIRAPDGTVKRTLP
ncbi:MAG: hypothetical protein H6709_08965 [Kofleriaceae bacterium]|nr:hypothetical protein [Kofleriaceae bacterium]MCB9572201.1 hypothetical protein [Kofleriaceae bacterium]